MQYNSVVLCYQAMHLLHIFSPDSDYFPSFRNIKMLTGGPSSDETPELQDVLWKASWAWPYKPGNLEYLTSSLFDVFDMCFKRNCMKDDEPVPQLFVVAEKNNFEPWNSYRKDVLKEVQKYISSRLTKDHQDCVMARLHYHLYYNGTAQGVPFICSSLLLVVNKQLRKCQQALVDVSDITLYWNADPIGLSDSPVVHSASYAASDVDSCARNLQIE